MRIKPKQKTNKCTVSLQSNATDPPIKGEDNFLNPTALANSLQ